MAANDSAPVTRRQALALGTAFAAGGLAVWAIKDGPEPSSVRAFGAKGDGRTDDTAAIQSAIESGLALLHFPAGTYRLTAPLRPASRQMWVGDGHSRSILVYGGDPAQPAFNLVYLRADIEDFTIERMGFVGGRAAQETPSPDGQGGFAIYIRGDLRGITLRSCSFTGCGDGKDGGGGVILGPAPQDVAKRVAHIVVTDCLFRDNGNVPGLYVSGGTERRQQASVTITGNRFHGVGGQGKIQNAVFVLGTPSAPIQQVNVTGNTFNFDTPVDAGIELNWVDGFEIAQNSFAFSAAISYSSAILLRDGSHAGAVVGNVITSTAAERGLRAIELLNFRHPGKLSDIVIANNVVSGVPRAIAIDRGAQGIVVSANRIHGGDAMGLSGIRVVDAANVTVRDNSVTAMRHAMVIGAGNDAEARIDNLTVAGNSFDRCGGDGLSLMAATGEGKTIRGILVRDNRVVDPLPGTVAFADLSLIQHPDCVISDNALGELPQWKVQ